MEQVRLTTPGNIPNRILYQVSEEVRTALNLGRPILNRSVSSKDVLDILYLPHPTESFPLSNLIFSKEQISVLDTAIHERHKVLVMVGIKGVYEFMDLLVSNGKFELVHRDKDVYSEVRGTLTNKLKLMNELLGCQISVSEMCNTADSVISIGNVIDYIEKADVAELSELQDKISAEKLRYYFNK